MTMQLPKTLSANLSDCPFPWTARKFEDGKGRVVAANGRVVCELMVKGHDDVAAMIAKRCNDGQA